MERTDKKSELLPFGSLNLNGKVLAALESEDFLYLSPIQQAAIPPLLKGRSVLALAPTGTGKTLSYVVPILNNLQEGFHPSQAEDRPDDPGHVSRGPV